MIESLLKSFCLVLSFLVVKKDSLGSQVAGDTRVVIWVLLN